MPEVWQEHEIRKIAANSPDSFTDGDWIEAPHIRDSGIRLIQTGNIGIGYFENRSKKYISAESFRELRCTEVYPGDLLICRLAEPIGRACFAPDLGERMITSVDVTIVKVDDHKFDPDFVAFSINTPDFLRKCELVSGGTTRQRISRSNLGLLKVSAPNRSRQKEIAEILSTVDEAIEQTEALIAKTQQIKAGLMHDLFTRGVTPDGQLRPPREEASELYKETPLGWIPKEWTSEFADKYAERIKVGVVNSATHAYVESGVPFIRSQNVKPNYIEATDMLYVSSAYNQTQTKSILREGDIVIVRTGYPGTAAVVSEEFVGANCFSLVIFQPDKSCVHPQFVAQYMNSGICKREIKRVQFGSAQNNFNIGEMKKLRLRVPDLEEQQRILNVLLAADRAIEAATLDRYGLMNQKSGLLTDLLSGRVEVAA